MSFIKTSLICLYVFNLHVITLFGQERWKIGGNQWKPFSSQRQSLECGIQKVQVSCDQQNSQDYGIYCNPNSRIIGGSESYQGEFPWLVLLTMRYGKAYCAGTLLDPYHILTASHCVYGFSLMDLARLRIVIGDHNIRSSYDGRHEERRVSVIFIHPKWNPKTNENDIAILKLRKPVIFTNYIQPICLAQSKLNDNYVNKIKYVEDENSYHYEVENKLSATIVGYGRTHPNHTYKSSTPIKATVAIRNHGQCQRLYEPILVTTKMFCASGDSGSDACLGDSGGPIMMKNPHTERWEQIGIISWGNSCHSLPGIYTRIHSFLPWIYQTLHTSFNQNINKIF